MLRVTLLSNIYHITHYTLENVTWGRYFSPWKRNVCSSLAAYVGVTSENKTVCSDRGLEQWIPEWVFTLLHIPYHTQLFCLALLLDFCGSIGPMFRECRKLKEATPLTIHKSSTYTCKLYKNTIVLNEQTVCCEFEQSDVEVCGNRLTVGETFKYLNEEQQLYCSYST